MSRGGATLAMALVAGLGAVKGAGLQDARIFSEVDTTLVTVGDRVHLTVVVEYGAGSRVELPDSVDLSPFEVLGAEAVPASTQGDRIRSGVVLTLTVFELGELEIPSFEVRVVGPGGESETLFTDRFGVEVVSVGADEGGDIRDIRGPLAIPLGMVNVGMLLLLLAAVLALAAWLARRWRRGAPPEKYDAPAKSLRPPHEEALEALARIEASPLLERRQVKDYHIAISEILRTYVERRFFVRALEMTTREISWGLDAAGVAREFREGLGRFLDRCDLVKFAKVRPADEVSRATLELGRELILGTVPTPESVGERGSGTTSASAASEVDAEVTA